MGELFTQAWQDFSDVIFHWDAVNLAIPFLMLVFVGSGLWKMRIRGIAWGLTMAALWAAFHAGVGRDEWGEVLFNGTLL